eukprot:9504195-Alexandrium_andersonii.AAC.1
MSGPVTTRHCKGGAPTARTSQPMQPSTRLRSAWQFCGALRPSTLVRVARSLSMCGTGWTAAWL